MFWDCWDVLAFPTHSPCIRRLGMGKIKEGGTADQRVIPYYIGFALQQKLGERTKKRGYLLFIFISWRNLYLFWSPTFQEVAEHHLQVRNREQNIFFPLLLHSLCFYFKKLFFILTTKSKYFLSPLFCWGGCMVGTWHSAVVNSSQHVSRSNKCSRPHAESPWLSHNSTPIRQKESCWLITAVT